MSSPSQTPSRRRSRSETESDEEGEEVRVAQRSASKRARREASDLPEPTLASGPSRSRRDNSDDENDEDDIEGGPGQFKAGAIVRVKLKNFVTYDIAEFFPGPNLNMVIGANGTGKSSLVCAICLGLGWGPQFLGRAGQVGEFVKHGMNDAQVEIELQRRTDESENHVVRLRIIKDGNQREFWLNGRKTSVKHIQALTKSLSIQIDNLCQFLPQDKVSEFAGLSPVELLQHTQRAAAPEYMLAWHEKLKALRKDQKALESQNATDQENLKNLQTRQQNLQGEVDRLQERNRIEERVKFLNYTIPMVEYRVAIAKHRESKANKLQAQSNLRDLEERIAPILQSITEKKEYRDEIEVVVKERKKIMDFAEREADSCLPNIDKANEECTKLEEKISQLKIEIKQGHKAMDKNAIEIRTLQGRLKQEPIIFDPIEMNKQVRAKEQEVKHLESQVTENKTRYTEAAEKARNIRGRRDAAEQELAAFNSQEGQKLNKLERVSKDTAKAWHWVQSNMAEFRQEVYPPAAISCSVKDIRYASAVESILSPGDFLAITAQNSEDMKKLSDQIETMGLAEVTLRTSNDQVPKTRPLSPDELKVYGMDGWALDFIDGPATVLAMLCNSSKVEKAAISLQDISEDQYNLIVSERKLRQWTTNKNFYKVTMRQEYGPSAVSTATRFIGPAKYWINQPVDLSARDEIQSRINEAEAEFDFMKEEVVQLRDARPALAEKIKDLKGEIETIKAKKDALQKAKSELERIPTKIERLEEANRKTEESFDQIELEIKNTQAKQNIAVIRKAKEALKWKEFITKIRTCHEEYIEARIRLIEAESDVYGLEQRNIDIVRQQTEERQRVKEIERIAKETKDAAKVAMNTINELLTIPEISAIRDELTEYSDANSVEAIQAEIDAEQSKLDFIHANNPNAIRDFERRKVEIEAFTTKIVNSQEKLRNIAGKITKYRDKWEPQLDALVAQISEAFSFNFEQISCAGEVSVHKDAEFEQWAIQIKVKFRETETLQLLDAHRQSGGERSVSTIFYLMALQGLAQAPFRVVDEINQGMDPRNERLVYDRMVDITCEETEGQYFLITPKLLTGLRYHKRMRVLCIASGEHMPEDYKRLDVSKIIGIRRAIMAAG